MESDKIKEEVKKDYGVIAKQCCSKSKKCCSKAAEDYSNLQGYVPSANLSLGCGRPTNYAELREGDTVLDLGCGAGNDCFVARALVGPTGKVIGIDMTEEMIQKARENVEITKFNNVEFRMGEIEKMPVVTKTIDAIISNCVLNLVPDKSKAFAEMFRVLKDGGHFSVSDMVTMGKIPEGMQKEAITICRCMASAIPLDLYLSMLKTAGFTGIKVQTQKKIEIPKDMLVKFFNEADATNYMKLEVGIYSSTIYAEKPKLYLGGCNCAFCNK
jgi:arsenite methyltransferase